MYFQRFSGWIGQWWFRCLRGSEPSGDEGGEDTRVTMPPLPEVRISRGGSDDSKTFGSCTAETLESGMRSCVSGARG